MTYSYVIKERQGKSLAFDCITTSTQLQQSLTIYSQIGIGTNDRVFLSYVIKQASDFHLSNKQNVYLKTLNKTEIQVYGLKPYYR
jgi:hypothetical protein